MYLWVVVVGQCLVVLVSFSNSPDCSLHGIQILTGWVQGGVKGETEYTWLLWLTGEKEDIKALILPLESYYHWRLLASRPAGKWSTESFCYITLRVNVMEENQVLVENNERRKRSPLSISEVILKSWGVRQWEILSACANGVLYKKVLWSTLSLVW